VGFPVLKPGMNSNLKKAWINLELLPKVIGFGNIPSLDKLAAKRYSNGAGK